MLNEMNCIYTIFLEKSFSKAAKKLYISQPALSNIVKKTEEKIGHHIFDRSTIPLSITKEGTYYIQCIESILNIEKNMLKYFADMKNIDSQPIVIGGSSYFCAYVFPKLIKKFNEKYPQVSFEIVEDSITGLLEGIEDNSIDLIFETAISEENKNLTTYLYDYEYVVLCVPSSMELNHKLSEYQIPYEDIKNRNFLNENFLPVPLKYFKNVPFVRMKQGNDLWKRGAQMCKNAGFNQLSIYQLDQILTALHVVVQTGSGALFIRDTLIKNFCSIGHKLVYYKIGDPLAKRKIFIATKKKRYLATSTKKFLDLFAKDPFLNNNIERKSI
ncbi:LysR substrate-binding domain-containing protein [Fusobacterium sp. PH5-44]|uniref:LysR substrate-binding domain-containing protein n=1 Tax=unclassified Fusobacterium TaxID=2648384 RepID=UPI003D1A9E73